MYAFLYGYGLTLALFEILEKMAVEKKEVSRHLTVMIEMNREETKSAKKNTRFVTRNAQKARICPF